MHAEITRMVDDFENGRLSRRQLIAHLTVMGAMMAGVARSAGAQSSPPATAPASTSTQPSGSTFKSTGIQHIALAVSDVTISRDFYVRHLGLKVTRDGGATCFLDSGRGLIGLYKIEQDQKPGMHHVSFSVEGFNSDDAAKRLAAAGLTPDRRGARVYFKDPDEIILQVAPTT
jgi:catechol 2,3-dioxygenase-like lactoylglutathione lyase family enzyme